MKRKAPSTIFPDIGKALVAEFGLAPCLKFDAKRKQSFFSKSQLLPLGDSQDQKLQLECNRSSGFGLKTIFPGFSISRSEFQLFELNPIHFHCLQIFLLGRTPYVGSTNPGLVQTVNPARVQGDQFGGTNPGHYHLPIFNEFYPQAGCRWKYLVITAYYLVLFWYFRAV